jgi:hypothetical protein
MSTMGGTYNYSFPTGYCKNDLKELMIYLGSMYRGHFSP